MFFVLSKNTAVCLYCKIQLFVCITKYSCVFVLQNTAVCLYYKMQLCVCITRYILVCLNYKIQLCVCITKYSSVFVLQNIPVCLYFKIDLMLSMVVVMGSKVIPLPSYCISLLQWGEYSATIYLFMWQETYLSFFANILKQNK